MKLITAQHYHSVVESILKEKERQAESLGQSFIGLSADELQREVDNHLGGAWSIKKEESVKFNKADINAVASARFFRKTGVTLLMGLVIILVAFALVVKSISIMTPLYYNIYYTVCGILTVVFLYIYSRKQSKVRKALWRQIGREEKDNED